MPSPRTKPSLTSIVAFAMLVLPVLYVLSYAPVVRLCDGPPPFATVYGPVDWMIDSTPLEEPLFKWADLWSVNMDFVRAQNARDQHRAVMESGGGSSVSEADFRRQRSAPSNP